MTLHVHTLAGCAPTPLAHYLKALGVLRLVAEQRDETVRGWWRDETFHIATSLTRKELERFFLDDYRPTPLITPWNAGSGFYKNWDAKAQSFRNSVAFDALGRIECTKASRFEPFRNGIRRCRHVIESCAVEIDLANSASGELDALALIPVSDDSASVKGINLEKGNGKEELIRRLYQVLPNDVRAFFDSVFALTVLSDGKNQNEFVAEAPPLWGTGGNDGKLEFTNNLMRRLFELFDGETGRPIPGSDVLLRSALWMEPAPIADFTPPLQKGDKERSIGMYLPSCAGGANMTNGFAADSEFNLWDYVLMLEGAVAFTTGVSRRASTLGLSKSRATAPFSMQVSGVGSGSVAACDERTKKSTKAEQWFPIWPQPGTWPELKTVLAEGRCCLGRETASLTVDAGRAIANLGIARGIKEFVRYAFIERNGQSTLATPVGRWSVPDEPPPNLSLIDDVDSWIDRLKFAGGDKNAPKAWGQLARACENAVLACCRPGSNASNWQRLFITLGEAESQLVRSPRFTASKGLQPLGAFTGGLNADWLGVVNDRSPELRLALALASQHGVRLRSKDGRTTTDIDWSNPVRRHFLPLEDCSEKGWTPRRFAVAGEKLRQDPSVVCGSGELEPDAIELVRRRILEGRQAGGSLYPLLAVRETEASLADVLKFMNGEVDPARLLELARPLMALDWTEFSKSAKGIRVELGYPAGADEREAADALALYGLLRLCHHGAPVPVPMPSRSRSNEPTQTDDALPTSEVLIRLDPSIFPRLASGQVQHAVQIAARRLRVSGLRPKLKIAVATASTGRRLAAALAFPVGWSGARLLAARLTRPTFKPGDKAPDEVDVNEAVS